PPAVDESPCRATAVPMRMWSGSDGSTAIPPMPRFAAAARLPGAGVRGGARVRAREEPHPRLASPGAVRLTRADVDRVAGRVGGVDEEGADRLGVHPRRQLLPVWPLRPRVVACPSAAR